MVSLHGALPCTYRVAGSPFDLGTLISIFCCTRRALVVCLGQGGGGVGHSSSAETPPLPSPFPRLAIFCIYRVVWLFSVHSRLLPPTLLLPHTRTHTHTNPPRKISVPTLCVWFLRAAAHEAHQKYHYCYKKNAVGVAFLLLCPNQTRSEQATC